MVDISRLLERCTFPPSGSSVDLAVSGGADSLALLVLAGAAGCSPVAYHVDHQLRPGSAEEADLVEQVASDVGARTVRLRVEVAPGSNLEERARRARFAVLPKGIATGHTADDQAETVLVNLLRGAGLAGLSGMRADERHPILALRRSETRALCSERGIRVAEDPTNFDPAHLRNRVRHELVPLLCDLGDRDVVPVIARQALLMAEENAFLEDLASSVDPLAARELAESHPVLSRRAVRNLLQTLGPDGRPPSAAAVERVLAVARKEERACEVEGGIRVSRSGGRIAVEHRP